MAANRRPQKNERARDAIQAGVLVKLLMDHATGEIDLPSDRVASIKILLAKVMADAPQEHVFEHTVAVIESTPHVDNDEFDKLHADGADPIGEDG